MLEQYTPDSIMLLINCKTHANTVTTALMRHLNKLAKEIGIFISPALLRYRLRNVYNTIKHNVMLIIDHDGDYYYALVATVTRRDP